MARAGFAGGPTAPPSLKRGPGVPPPLSRKIVRVKKSFSAQAEEQRAKGGALVRFEEPPPISKMKRWKLKEVVRRAVQIDIKTGRVLEDEIV